MAPGVLLEQGAGWAGSEGAAAGNEIVTDSLALIRRPGERVGSV